MSVLLLSGGLDSTVLLAQRCMYGDPVTCVSFDYRQRHRRELASAFRLARHYDARHVVLGIPAGLLSGGCLTDLSVPVPHAHHEDPVQAATVVPNRNATMLLMAAALAARLGEPELLFAAHAGDAAIYPDCRPEFVEAIDRATRMSCGVAVRAPFLRLDKRAIVGLGRTLGVPFEMTWTCYEGGEEPCQACGACRELAEAMA
jgi:7-cyano-7-deazaguanine synthase